MGSLDKFVDRQKAVLMYDEFQEANDVGAMLDQSPTNSRVNDAIAVIDILDAYADMTWKGKYKDLLGSLSMRVQRLYLNMEAFSREQAIAMARGKAIGVLPEEAEKKKGLLGVLGAK